MDSDFDTQDPTFGLTSSIKKAITNTMDEDEFDDPIGTELEGKDSSLKQLLKQQGKTLSNLTTTTPSLSTTTVTEYGETRPTLNSGLTPIVQNVVSTVNLAVKLDLKVIALHARNAEYNPKRFAAVIMRIREPKTTALIFASGKIVCTGARSEDESRLAARKYARIIQKLGFDVKFTEFKIQNIVGSVDVGFPIRLEGLQSAHTHFSSYEPELFPGLIYRMVQPKIVLLIFVSGKLVLTGAKAREEIKKAFDNIYPILLDFKKETQAPPQTVEKTKGSK